MRPSPLLPRLVACCGLFLPFGPVVAGEAEWSKVSEVDGIEVHARSKAGSAIREVRATIEIDAPPARVFEVVLDWRQFTRFMPYLVEVDEVAREGPALWYLYQRISPPLVSERDYTLRHRSTADPQRGRYEVHWEAANDRGRAPRDGVVRVEICTGSYTIEGLPGGDRTRLTYQLYTDPGGSLPKWIANIANTESVPKLLQAIARRSVDPDWRR